MNKIQSLKLFIVKLGKKDIQLLCRRLNVNDMCSKRLEQKAVGTLRKEKVWALERNNFL